MVFGIFKRVSARVMREFYRPRIKVRGSNRLVRLGSEYGGWWFEDSESLHGCRILSCGLGEDASFDTEFAAKYNANVLILDPTPKAIMHFNLLKGRFGEAAECTYVSGGSQPVSSYDLSQVRPEQIVLVPKAIWTDDKPVRFYAPEDATHVSHSIARPSTMGRSYIEVEAATYSSICKNSDDEFHLIKMDIEGAEIAVLEDILNDKRNLPEQILVEFDVLQNAGVRSRAQVESLDGRLREFGFECRHYDGLRSYLYCRH